MGEAENPPVDSAPEEIAIIVAAVDTSAGAGGVIETAARLARRTWSNSQLHIIHVLRAGMFDRAPPGGTTDDQLPGEAQNHLDYQVRTAQKQCSASVTGHFAKGDPAEEIVRLAVSVNADIVLVGTHDAVGFGRLLVGSVAETVARKAPCSVLVVRPKRRRTAARE